MSLSFVVFPLLFALGQNPAPVQPATGSGDELRTAFDNLKSAEEKKDVDLIKKYAVESSQLARKALESAEPAQASEAEAWKAQMELARQAEPYADYALYTAAIKTRERAKVVDLFETLEKQSPKSQYVPQLYGVYLAALTQGGQASKAYDFASKALAKDPNNEELLLVLGDGAMTRKQWDRAAGYGLKVAAIMSSHPKPEGMAAADWERRKTLIAGRGYWIAGISYATLNKYPLADRNLRAALPLIKGEASLMNGALFYLGVADYNLARATQDKVMMKQALAFSEEAFKVGGQFAQSANQNVFAIKQELGRMR
jgi:hypothetical protein